MKDQSKLQLFLENARRLNKRFGITPLLYGSVGLEYITGTNLSADDIDILIPKAYLLKKWEDFRKYMETIGYVLTDEHEHTFEKDSVSYSYASIEELEAFAGITVSDIKTEKRGGTGFMILSAEQYLQVYKSSATDGYRLNVKEKKDLEKIELIKSFIAANDRCRDPHKAS